MKNKRERENKAGTVGRHGAIAITMTEQKYRIHREK